MIDREKTIQKAMSKYRSIYPVRGKHTLSECFFCWRGEHYFLFKTQDKKGHMMKAEFSRPAVSLENINLEAFSPIYKALNKPIFVRSLFNKNTDQSQQAAPPDYINLEFFSAIYKALTKPIVVPPLFTKKTRIGVKAPTVAQCTSK